MKRTVNSERRRRWMSIALASALSVWAESAAGYVRDTHPPLVHSDFRTPSRSSSLEWMPDVEERLRALRLNGEALDSERAGQLRSPTGPRPEAAGDKSDTRGRDR